MCGNKAHRAFYHDSDLSKLNLAFLPLSTLQQDTWPQPIIDKVLLKGRRREVEDFAHPDGHPAGRVLLSVQENLLQALKEEHCSGKCQALWAGQETSYNFHASFLLILLDFQGCI